MKNLISSSYLRSFLYHHCLKKKQFSIVRMRHSSILWIAQVSVPVPSLELFKAMNSSCSRSFFWTSWTTLSLKTHEQTSIPRHKIDSLEAHQGNHLLKGWSSHRDRISAAWALVWMIEWHLPLHCYSPKFISISLVGMISHHKPYPSPSGLVLSVQSAGCCRSSTHQLWGLHSRFLQYRWWQWT